MHTAALELPDLVLDGLAAAGSGRSSDAALAAVLGALSDPIRLRIVAQLADGEEHSCGSFGLPVTKSTCSHHFRVLRDAGIIATRVDGKNRFNLLQRELLEQRFPGLLDAVLSAHHE
jgi:DNA-binding transcriptional ArsR family regulator